MPVGTYGLVKATP